MKGYGYQKNDDCLLELEEMTIQCSIEELDKLIDFLQSVKKEHKDLKEVVQIHSHFRDWDKNGFLGELDIIIVNS